MLGRFRTSQYRYSRLSAAGEKGDEALCPQQESTEELIHLPRTKQSSIAFYSAIICVLCTLVNVSALLYRQSRPSTFNLSLYELQSPSRTDLRNLRRPSQFVGLDKIKRPFPPVHAEIINFPMLVGRVDEANPWTAIADRPETRRISNSGIEARKVEARGSVETVIQFRMIDWGMELCTLRVRLPRQNDTHLSSNVVLGNGTNELEIYRLQTDSVIDLDSLTFHTRPGKDERIGAINAAYGMDWRYDFPCLMDTLHTFSIAPGTNMANVEWWQDKQAEFPAVYIVQHSTK